MSWLANPVDNTLGISDKFKEYSYVDIVESLTAVYLAREPGIEDAKSLSCRFPRKIAGIWAVQSPLDAENTAMQGIIF